MLINCICAQLCKFILTQDIHFQNKSVWQKLKSSGGTPSTHTTFVVTGAYLNYIDHGLQAPITQLSILFMIVVMYDAIGVRNHVTKLNQVVKQILLKYDQQLDMQEYAFLNEQVGHTVYEVLYGFIFSICMTTFLKYVFSLHR